MKQKSLLLVLALVLVFVMTSAVACNIHEHTWSDWQLTTPPTETATGTATRTCECGETENKTDVPVLTDTSVWTMTETPATHESEGSKVYTSEYGTVTISIPKGEHSYGAWTIITEPTMEAEGSAERSCECGDKDTAVLPVLSDTTVWTVKSTTPSTCAVQGETVYTSVYGDVTVKLALLDHTYGAWTITDEPTMDEEGLAERVCECTHKDTAVLPVLSDTTVWTVKSTTPSTCAVQGETVYTSVYGDVTVKLALLDHTYGAWTIADEPTMDEEGLAERVCECTHKDTAVLPVLSDTTVWTVKSTTPSTCTVQGETVYTSVYGDVTVKLALLDHTYGAWTITDEPTMDEEGLAERVCECTHKDTAVLPVLGDTTVWTSATVPADYNNGSVTTYTSKYGSVVVNGDDKLVAPYDGKTYSSVYIDTDGKLYGSQSVGISWNSALLTVDSNGVASSTAHPWNGVGQFVMIDPAVGKFEIHWDEDGELTTTVGYVDMETGVFVFPYDTTYDYFHIAVPSDVAVSGSLFTACVIDGAVAVQYSNGEVVSNIFTRNNNVYMGATFESDDEAATVGQLFECKTVTVKDKSGNVIVTYVEDSEGNLVVADGVQGVYEGDLGTMTLSGSGNVTFDNGGVISNGTYELYENSLGVYVDGKYYDVTLNGEEYTAVATEVTITFNLNGVTPSEEFVESVSVNKNIEYSLPVYTNETMQFKGWFYDMYCTFPVTEPFTPVADIELFASWAPKLVINLEGVLEGDDSQILLGVGDVIGEHLPQYVLNETSNADGTKYFAGWYLDAEFTTALPEDAVLTEDDNGATIYAKWIDAFTMSGNYIGWNLYSSGGDTKQASSMSSKLTIGFDGAFSGSRLDDGTIDVKYMTLTDGAFTADGTYIYYNHSLGILWYAYNTNASGVSTDTMFMIKSKGVSSIDFSRKNFDDVFTAWMTINYTDGTSRNAFLYNNKVYADVTWTEGVTAKNAYNTDNIIYDNLGNGIVANKGGELFVLDGFQGTYTCDGMDNLVLDGIGNFTWGDKEGTYQLIEGSNLALYVVIDGTNSEYWEVTLLDGTYTAVKPEVTITFEVVGPQGATEVMDAMSVNKNIAVLLPDGSTFNTSFVFNGYFTDIECANAVADPFVATQSVTIYAKYSAPAVLTIVYNDETTENSVITYSVGDIVNVERPVYVKHMFLGWYTTSDFQEGTEWNSGSTIEVDTTIYAKWDVAPVYNATYGIVRLQNNDAIADKTNKYSSGTIAFDPYGHSDKGSYPFNSATQIEVVDSLTGELTITIGSTVYSAIIDWESGIIIMDYRGNDTFTEAYLLTPFENGSVVSDNISSSYWGDGMCRAVEYTYDGTRYGVFIKDAQVYFGATFKSTNDFASADNNVAGEECYLQDGLYVFDAEGNLLDQPNIEVTFDLGGNGDNHSITINAGFAVSIADRVPVFEGFIFRGWYVDSEFETLADDPFVTAISATLYAKWDEAVTLTYKYLDGTTADVVVTDYFANDAVESVEVVDFKFGELVFAGWFTLDGSTTGEWGEQFVAGHVLTADTTVYAKWIEGYVMNGTYVGLEVWQDKSETKSESSFGGELAIDVVGNFEGERINTGVIDEQYKDITEGSFIIATRYAYYNDDLGMLVYSYYDKPDTFSYDYYIFMRDGSFTSVDYSGNKFENAEGEDIYVTWMTISYADGSTRNVFIYEDMVYADVTWSNGVTALTGSKSDHAIYASDGSLIVVKKGDQFVGLDGYQGTYTGTLNGDSNATEIVIDGTGSATVGGVATVYTLAENNITFVVNNRMMTVALTLDGFTYAPVADGYQGTYTLPDQSTLTLDGYGKAGDLTYVVNGALITIYSSDSMTEYGLDVANKQLLGKSIFAGYVFTGTYVDSTGWSSDEYEYTLTFDDTVVISGTLELSETYSSTSYTFTATFDGTTLVITLTSGSYIGDTIEATLSGNALTITKDFGSSYYDMEDSVATCPNFGA